MLTIRLLTILIAGLIFTFVGFLSFKKKRVSGLIFIIIGLFLIYTQTIGPLSHSEKNILEITNIDSTKVQRIKLFPSDESGVSTLDSGILIQNRTQINQLCQSLNKANIEGEGFLKSPEWRCRVVIELNTNEKIIFGIKRQSGITGLTLNSNGETGWHYGNLKAIEFGLGIDKIVKKTCHNII